MSTETDEVRVWLVERGYNNRDLIILKYATPDGERLFRRELAAQALDSDSVTAAKDVPPTDSKPSMMWTERTSTRPKPLEWPTGTILTT